MRQSHMKKLAIPVLMIFYSMVSCTSALGPGQEADRTQSPPTNARWLTLIMKAEDDVEPAPVSLKYESEKCKEVSHYGVGGQSQSGSTLMRALNFEKIDLVREPVSSTYKARIAIDAGGRCQWKLVSLETSIRYKSRNHLINGREVLSGRYELEFMNRKDSVRSSSARVQYSYIPVILVKGEPLKNEARLDLISGLIPPSFDPSTSITMTLEPKVFGDMAKTIRAAPKDALKRSDR